MTADLKPLIDVMKRAASPDPAVAGPARTLFAKAALEGPIKEAVFPGDIFSDLFVVEDRPLGQDVRIPTGLIRPGQEKDFSAYAVPSQGALPVRLVDHEFIRVPTYENGNAIDLPLRAFEYGDLPLVKLALEHLMDGVRMKMNNDAWKCVIRAAAGRNKVIYDEKFAPGGVSLRLFGLMRDWFTQSAGNTSSVNNFALTRLYMSLPMRTSMLSWKNDDADDYTRRQVVTDNNGAIGGLLGVEFRDLVELGVGSPFQEFYETTLSGELPEYDRVVDEDTTVEDEVKLEILVGVDTRPARKRLFNMPVVKRPEVHQDDTRRRAGEVGWYCRFEYGTAVLDERVALLGAA